MIELRASTATELPEFAKMETAPDTADYILAYDEARHRAEFERDGIVYLSIYWSKKLAGFFILALDPDPDSVEFRRIVIAERGQGTAQAALARRVRLQPARPTRLRKTGLPFFRSARSRR